jgi:hypothetical protein
MTRTSAEEGATMFRYRISAVMPMIGSVMTMTWLTKFQGSHLYLKKMSQTTAE